MKFGYFDQNRREYVVTSPNTPAPWSNYLGNSVFGSLITNNAAGYTFYRSAVSGCLTRMRFNSTTAELSGKFIYLRDQESGDFWSASWQPVAKPLSEYKSECRHGMGYTVMSSSYNGIETEAKFFIPLEAAYEVWQLKVKNSGAQTRQLSIFPFIEPGCNWHALDDARNLQYVRFINHSYGSVAEDGKSGLIDVGSNINMPTDEANFENKDQARHLFFAAKVLDGAVAVDGYDSDLTQFQGAYGTYARPEAVVNGLCKNSTCVGDLPCGAFRMSLTLQPGEEASIAVFYGVGKAEEVGAALCNRSDLSAELEKNLADIQKHWQSRMTVLSAETPSQAFNDIISTWAPYNNLMTFYWSRTASLVYAGARDGLGYRDTAQDIVGAAALVTEEAKARLELLLTGQCSTGGAMPVVKPFAHHPGKEKAPEESVYRSDDCLWLFNSVPALVKETGDFDFYKKVLPYADKGEATVLGHLRRAIEFNLERSGAHGLPCGLAADWNDCIKLGAKGESLFVAFQLRYAFVEYIDIATRLKEEAEVAWAKEQLAVLDAALDKYSWDGEWFLRAYREDGETFGSKENPEGSIYMNTQTWAVLSGYAQGEKAQKAMDSMHDKLASKYGIALCAPPYVTTDPSVCVSRLFNPGMKENGAVFNHTQGWAVLAAAKLGLNERAWEYLYNILPSRFNDIAEIREVEPYVVCQSTASKFSPRHGLGRVPWLSGSAVWNYVAMTTAILGICPEYDGLRISPCIPAEWPGFHAVRHYRGCSFDITVTRGECACCKKPQITVNGTAIEGDTIRVAMFTPETKVEVVI